MKEFGETSPRFSIELHLLTSAATRLPVLPMLCGDTRLTRLNDPKALLWAKLGL